MRAAHVERTGERILSMTEENVENHFAEALPERGEQEEINKAVECN